MLCTICDNITLKSLNRSLGYEHMPSFHALKASAEDGLCSLCRILWREVDAQHAQEEIERVDEGDDEEEDNAMFMDYPVRLVADGMIYENRDRALKKLRDSYYDESDKGEKSWLDDTHELYDLHKAKAPARLLVCSLQPEDFEPGLRLKERGSASLYREPRKSKVLVLILHEN